MARNQKDTRIPVYRSGIPLALGGPRVRQTTQLPVRAGTRPTALDGLTAHWPSLAPQPEKARQPNTLSPSSTNSTPSSESTAAPDRIPDPGPGALPRVLSEIHLGREVLVGGTKPGILRFLGTVPFDTGLFCGVELYKPEGLNDGCVRGIRLFQCEPQHGVLAPLRKVSLLPPGKNPALSPVSPLQLNQRQQEISPSRAALSSGQLPAPCRTEPHQADTIPSGVKRQRTNAYESEASSPVLPPPDALEEDEVSTPREEVVTEEGGGSTAEERWSSEEVTPPAEEQTERAASLLCPPATAVLGEERETPREENERSSKPGSLSSVPSPIAQKTLEWSFAKTSGSGSGSIISSLPRQPRSISDGSISEMAGVVSTSTPAASAPLGPRCSRRPTGTNANAAGPNGSRQQGVSQVSCGSDCVFAGRNGAPDEGYGAQLCGGEMCACGRELSKHSSFEMDESLGILTPEQMIDFTVCMDGYGRTPSIDDMKRFDSNDLSFPAADHFGRTTQGELQSAGRKGFVPPEDAAGFPEELEALSPDEAGGAAVVESPTLPPPPEDLEEGVVDGRKGLEVPSSMEGPSDVDEEAQMEDEDEEEVKDVMGEPCMQENHSSVAHPNKTSQVAPCFVASVTSITSIDPGYQGDGEWSRPASRADNSPGSSAPPGIGVNFGGIPVDVLKLKIDTMTDSDFYSDTGAGGTESDADHEEAVREGAMAAGDRRAQVIDGTLYGGGQHGSGGPGGAGVHGGGASHQQQAPPRCFAAVMTSSTATTTEEMESSGVFSDLDRRVDVRASFHSSQALPRPSSAQGVSSSAAESSDVPQSPLEELPEDPKKDATFALIELEADKVAEDSEEDVAEIQNVEMDDTMVAEIGEKMDTSSPPAEAADEFSGLNQQEPQSSVMSCDESPDRTLSTTTQPISPTPRPGTGTPGTSDQQHQELEAQQAQQQQQDQQQQPPQQGQQSNQQQQQQAGNKQKSAVNVSPPKKHKMPKRNVASKIKAMIESTPPAKEQGDRGEEGEGSAARRQASRGPGRWDAIMSKIAAGQAEQRTSRPRLREVKSRVMASIGTASNPSRNATTSEEGGGTVRAKKSFISNGTRARRGETRRARARALDMSSLRDATCVLNAAAPPGDVGGSLNPSIHSSMSDVSLSRGGAAKNSVSSRSSKKREADRSASPYSDGSSNSGASNIPRPMRPHLGAIPRQPSHPPRERARAANTNGTTAVISNTKNTNVATTLTSTLAASSNSSSAAVLRRNQRNITSSATPSPKRVNAGPRRLNTAEKGTSTEMKAPTARKPATRHLSSGTQVQKPAPLRENNRLGGNGVVSKNGGPANNHAGNARGGNAVVLLQRQHMPMATAEAPPPTTADAMVETVSSPIPTPKGPPPIPPKLLEELKQSATRIEALLALIQYLVVDLDAFSTPSLKKAVEGYKTEVINAKLNLDEAVATCQRLMEEKELSEARHKENINELLRKNEENIKELEAKLNSQVEETQLRYEEELKRRDRLNNRNMESLLEDLKLYVERAEKADKQVEDGMRELEIVKKEKEDILAREMDLKQLNTRLQSEIADLTEKLRKETVIKAGDCGKHRDEIQSLQAVLDLKTKELHDHRKKLEELKQKSDALNPALARNAALQARVEDLEVQLQRKVASERKLQERVRHLSENVERESRQNEQLALENEVLEWKINESSKLMASFSGQSDMSSSMTGSMMASSSPSSDRRSNSIMAISLGSPDSPPNFAFPRFSPRLSPKSPFSDVSGTIELEEEEDDMEDEDEDKVKAGGGRGGGEEEEEGDEEDDDEDDEEEEDDIKLSFESLPITPKVRTLVEKNESISWLVEMEEVIPASSLLQSAGMRRSNPQQSSPLNLLPQMIPELPPLASNSPSTSPTSSDPSSSVFRGSGKGKVSPTQQHLVRRGSAQQPVKKTRPERGKLAGHGMMYSSTPSGHHHLTTSLSHGHHHRRYHHHHHQPRSTSRLPPSDSPMCSARSRSVSTDSESLEAEEASAAANARLAELKAWRSGAKAFACTSGGERASQPLQKSGDEEDGGKKDKEGDWEVNGDAKFSEGRLVEEGSRGDTPPGPKPPTPMGIDRDSPSKNGSPFCDFGEDFSDQSPFRGKFEVNGTSLNPMEDSSSSVEITLETTPKKQPTSSQPSQGSSPGGTQASAPLSFPTKQFVPTSEASPSHQMVHHHYQQRHVLSSLCAHPHLAIKESAGEAMISEEISDDTQGESDDEDNRAEGKLLEDSDEDDELEGVEVGLGHVMLQNRLEVIGVPDVVPMPVAKPSVTTPVRENGKETKSSNPEVQEEQTAGNTLKLGQQLLSSSTPDSSQFPHTDSSVMDLSWSEDLDLMPSESEV